MLLSGPDTRWVKRTHLVDASHPRKISTVRQVEERCKIVVDEYCAVAMSDALGKPLTLVMTHGTSFNRGLWEMIIEDFTSRPQLKGRLRRVLTLDAVNHGDSAVHNEKILGSEAHWPDNSRDILIIMESLHVNRPVVGIGHSFGGGTLCHAALMEPSLFDATIFIEPILFQMKEQTQDIARQTLRRRDKWDSVDDIRASFTKAFKDWNSHQLETYVNTGTRRVVEDSNEFWVLKTPKEQEAATYLAAPYPRILDLLENSHGKHYFIFGSESKVINTNNRREVERRLSQEGSVIIVQNAGHLIPMTHPTEISNTLENILIEVHDFVSASVGCKKNMSKI